MPFASCKSERIADIFFRRLGILKFSVQPYSEHIKASELVEKIGENLFHSYFSFAIVRNPWDWQVSLYSYMLSNTNHHQHNLVKKLKDFDGYIKWRCTKEVKLQKDFICSEDGKLLVDFVGKFENLEADFQTICSRIGISTSLPRLNISVRTPYQTYYSEETMTLVRDAFDADITLFNYEF